MDALISILYNQTTAMPNSTEAMARDPRSTITKHNTANKKLYGLDHLRALAIVLIFGFHYAEAMVRVSRTILTKCNTTIHF